MSGFRRYLLQIPKIIFIENMLMSFNEYNDEPTKHDSTNLGLVLWKLVVSG